VQPAVSIVMATYNRSRWLACAIRSVLRQTFSDWELVVVGDACTDDTPEVVAGFGDSRIRFLNLTRNFGEQAGPNNIGVAESKAPLVAFLNHDDVWLPDHLALCREVLLAEGADFVFGAAAYINAQSAIPLSFEGLSISIAGAGSGDAWSPAGVEDSVVPASSWMVRREVFEKLRGWRLGRDCFTDPSQDFLFRAWRAGFRLRPVREITAVMVTSARRPGAYQADGAAEQEWVLEHLEDPGFACELAALAYESNDHFNARTGGRLALVKRLSGHLLAAAGLSPRSLAFRFQKGFSSGEYIRSLRRGRGLPAFSPPGGNVPAIRFDMVRRSCRISPPASIEFAPGAGGARFLAHGWSWPEPGGVWNDGPDAALLFDLGCRPSCDVLVDLEVAPFLAPGDSRRVVEAYLGEEPLESWALAAGEQLRQLRIPSKSLRHSMVMVKFRFPSTTSPKACGLSDDQRDLAMRLTRSRIALDSTPEP
jgi:glycosyltransferase involved in cell wall biosynthesis